MLTAPVIVRGAQEFWVVYFSLTLVEIVRETIKKEYKGER